MSYQLIIILNYHKEIEREEDLNFQTSNFTLQTFNPED